MTIGIINQTKTKDKDNVETIIIFRMWGIIIGSILMIEACRNNFNRKNYANPVISDDINNQLCRNWS